MTRTHLFRLAGISGVLFLKCGIGLADPPAAAPSATVPRSEYDRLKQEVDLLKDQMRMLLDERAKTAERKTVEQAAPGKAPESRKAEAKPAPGQPKPAADKELGLKEGDREKEAERARQDLDEFLRRQKVVVHKGDLQLEWDTTYNQETTDIIPVKSNFRSVSTGVFTRYGLLDDVELNLLIPFVYAEREIDPSLSRITTRPPQLYENRSHAGLGDISGAVRWSAIHEEGLIPETTLNFNFKADNGESQRLVGSGFWTLGGTVTMVKTIDPVVFFGSVGYRAVLEKNGINPGDQIPYSVGMGFSLNDRVSFSTSLNGAAVLSTSVRGFGDIPGSGDEIQLMNFAATVQLARNLFLEPFVGFGLTDDSTDFIVGINIPYRFENRFPIPFFE